MIFGKQIEQFYRKQLFTRYDETGTIFRFSAKDFPGLHQTAYPFKANAGHTLQGYFYHYDHPIPGRVVVFDHGLGGGHRSYMKEVEMLCRHGYLVFTYDHTGCMESGGEDTHGFAQSLNDLDACLTTLKSDPAYRDMDFSVVGHSWGGFSTMNITALHPYIRHVVAMSGFISVPQMLKQVFSGLLSPFRSVIYALEQQSNPDYVTYSALDTLSTTQSKVLLIHSTDDPTVKASFHFDVLRSHLAGRENIRFLPLLGKRHNPNYTADAVTYMEGYFKDLNRKTRRKELESDEQKAAFIAAYDWHRMTAQDKDVWQEIFSHLDS